MRHKRHHHAKLAIGGGLLLVLALLAWANLTAPKEQKQRAVVASIPAPVDSQPCGESDPNKSILIPVDANAGRSYGAGWVRLWYCDDGRIFAKHFGAKSPVLPVIEDVDIAEYSAAARRARARGLVVAVTK